MSYEKAPRGKAQLVGLCVRLAKHSARIALTLTTVLLRTP